MTSAQGQLMTRKVSARSSQVTQPPPSTSGGSTASASAAAQTAGVYQCANLVMKFSTFAFFRLEFSTRSKILATVDSPYTLVVRMRSSPCWLTQPLMTSSPGRTVRGRLSPVRAAVSSVLSPLSTTPSRGIFSPGRTAITAPTGTSSGSVTVSVPSAFSKLALSGRMSISALMLRRLLPTA